jgi:hypothetical protein
LRVSAAHERRTSSLQVTIKEFSRSQNFKFPVTRHLQQVFIPTHDDSRITGKSACQKLVVSRIFTHLLPQVRRRHDNRPDCHEIKEGSQIDNRKSPGKPFSNSSILIQYPGRDHQLNLPCTSCVQDLVRRAAKENTGYKYVSVQYYLHLSLAPSRGPSGCRTVSCRPFWPGCGPPQ